MKGTEKQIKWATSIIEDAQNTIRANIELNTRRGDEKELKLWQWMEGEYSKALQMVGDNASLIIDNRKKLDVDRINYLVSQARMGYIKI